MYPWFLTDCARHLASVADSCFRWLCKQGQERPPDANHITPQQLVEYMEVLVRSTHAGIREARAIAETRGNRDVRQLFWALDAVILPPEGPHGHLAWPTVAVSDVTPDVRRLGFGHDSHGHLILPDPVCLGPGYDSRGYIILPTVSRSDVAPDER